MTNEKLNVGRGIATVWIATALFSLTNTVVAQSSAPLTPALPQLMDTTYAVPSGSTINVAAGGNLQTAINQAKPGDTIVVQAGASFVGPFNLPKKTTGTGWIYIQSSAYASLPAPGSRVRIADAVNMPTLIGGPGLAPAVTTSSGASQYRFVGIEMRPPTGEYRYALVQIGNGETTIAALPNNIIIDRCYLHGDPNAGTRRGVAMNGASIAVVDSYLSDFKEVGADSQALWAANTPGPIKIVNNYLEGAGENILFGGADPTIKNVVPSDLEIRRNFINKPLAWLNQKWVVKNSVEFKLASRALLEGNHIENNWASGQSGFTILLTPRDQNGTAPWTKVSDITVRLNQLINIAQGINILGVDDLAVSQITERVLIKDNLILINGLSPNGTVTGATTGQARLFQILSGPKDVTIDHNTAIHIGGTNRAMFMTDGSPNTINFRFSNNIATHGDYGFFASGGAEGTNALNRFYTNWSFPKNALISSSSSAYPAGNFFPAAISAVGFTSSTSGDYRLLSTSAYKGAGTDGLDLGANIGAITDAINGAPRPLTPTSVRAN